jgi:hypothetical protein
MSDAYSRELPMKIASNLTKRDQIPALIAVPIFVSASDLQHLSIKNHSSPPSS